MRFFVIAFAVIAATSAASISSEYLAPLTDNNLLNQEYLPPAGEEPSPLADDGYRYKTVRKLKLRHRRDINELAPINEYLPPTQDSQDVVAGAAEEQTVVADDGYRYKTVRRLKLRHRRDVNELPANEYLPPTEESQEVVVVESPEEKTLLAEDGYRYKTVRRLKLRHRRDVNELPANEYLPPVEKSLEVFTDEEAPEEKTVLAEDGYRYKTVRRLKLRHRRDVNELPINEYLEYLPPTEESQEVVVVESPEEKTLLAEDGYRYKTVRRLKLRHRRDVNELPANEYLPPVEKSLEVFTDEEAPEEKTVLAEDGYRYKTVRRLKLRHRRDVNELPVNEYLPPTAEESQDQEVAVQNLADSAVLANDGYRYKTVRRLKYRRH